VWGSATTRRHDSTAQSSVRMNRVAALNMATGLAWFRITDRGLGYCTLMPAALMTGIHRSISAR
jgi:hypothetical protein